MKLIPLIVLLFITQNVFAWMNVTDAEKYDLTEIKYIGQSKKEKATYKDEIRNVEMIAAIILLPNGKKMILIEGDPIGKNHGLISKVYQDHIEVKEVVPSCDANQWAERINFIPLQGISSKAFSTLNEVICQNT